ncbi:MAG: stage II sporulation protein M [Sulfolobales archaeon]|nr:stage II sporulation protein M [Sulfolobales archaeon]MCX8208310.1 stage II sporulation protein M [Sulfolobales archaeon]MDW8010008.1 stage II sporulation protein M [Sulfolobales archaeon]
MRSVNSVSLALTLSVFFTAVFAGLVAPAPFESVEEQISTLVKPVERSEDPASRLAGLVSIILYNNVGVAIRCVALGFTLIFPLYVLYANGYIIGSVVSFVGYGSIALVPHGVFELPAIVYSSYLGVRIGVLVLISLVLRIKSREPPASLLREYVASLARLSYALLFLAIAAFVEVFVSLPIGYILR